MSVPIAVVGWIPKTRISSGVISDPPPMPVMPTRTPMPRPNRMIAGSIDYRASTRLSRLHRSGRREGDQGTRLVDDFNPQTCQLRFAHPAPRGWDLLTAIYAAKRSHVRG